VYYIIIATAITNAPAFCLGVKALPALLGLGVLFTCLLVCYNVYKILGEVDGNDDTVQKSIKGR